MSKKSIVLLFLITAVPLALYLLWPTDESRIRKLFSDGAKAVEQRKPEVVMSRISFNYTDDHGLSYLMLKRIIEQLLAEMKNITVEYEVKTIKIMDDKASATIDVRVIATRGKDTGYFIGDAAKPSGMKFSLEKERTKWLITKAEGFSGSLAQK